MDEDATPKYFDAHGHPHFSVYANDIDAMMERARAYGVWMNAVGTNLATSRDAVAFAERFGTGVFATIGIHPAHDDTGAEVFDAPAFEALGRESCVVAIGECGLDYVQGDAQLKQQQEVLFRQHIDLSLRLGKPLMLHVRSVRGSDTAYFDALSILAEYQNVAADFHFFSGSWNVAKKILDAGFYISFDGPITFARDYDEVIKNAPLDLMMAETDCPYASPLPYRGKRNEPAYVSHVVDAIARIRGVESEDVRHALLASTRHFFGV